MKKLGIFPKQVSEREMDTPDTSDASDSSMVQNNHSA
jgi:hypothetical protein